MSQIDRQYTIIIGVTIAYICQFITSCPYSVSPLVDVLYLQMYYIYKYVLVLQVHIWYNTLLQIHPRVPRDIIHQKGH